MKAEPRRCKEERTVLSRNSARKTSYPAAKNTTGHPPHRTETSPKSHHFPYRALSLLSPLRIGLPAQHLAARRKRLLCPHFSLFQHLFADQYWLSPAPLNVDAAPLSRSLSPDGSWEAKLHQLYLEPSLRAECACARRSGTGMTPPAHHQVQPLEAASWTLFFWVH